MKVKEFLTEKLNNFEHFIEDEMKKINIDESKKDELINSLKQYSSDLNLFTQSIMLLVKFKNIDQAVSIFLLNYDINIDDIKDNIDYNKLCRYLEMFLEMVKK